MKKLLSLLSVLTISGTAVPTTIAASPYQKEETIKNSYINYSQANNSEKLNRIKRNNNEIAIPIENHDNLIFNWNFNSVDWVKIWGLNWILKINANNIQTIINWMKNNPNTNKKILKNLIALSFGTFAAYLTDELSRRGFEWPTTVVAVLDFGVLTAATTIAKNFFLKLKLLDNILNLITNPHFVNNGIWIAFNTLNPKEDIGKLNENGNIEISSDTDSYYSANSYIHDENRRKKREAYYETWQRFFATNKHKLNLNYYDWTDIAYNFDMKKEKDFRNYLTNIIKSKKIVGDGGLYLAFSGELLEERYNEYVTAIVNTIINNWSKIKDKIQDLKINQEMYLICDTNENFYEITIH